MTLIIIQLCSYVLLYLQLGRFLVQIDALENVGVWARYFVLDLYARVALEYFGDDDVDDAADDCDQVEDVPEVGREVLGTEGDEFEGALGREEDREDDVDVLEHGFDVLGLVVPLHHEDEGVGGDEEEDEVLEGRAGDELPDAVAGAAFDGRHVELEGLGVQSELHAGFLWRRIEVEMTIWS